MHGGWELAQLGKGIDTLMYKFASNRLGSFRVVDETMEFQDKFEHGLLSQKMDIKVKTFFKIWKNFKSLHNYIEYVRPHMRLFIGWPSFIICNFVLTKKWSQKISNLAKHC